MSRRGWIIIVVVLAVAAAVLVGVLLATAGGGATVPDVTGMTQDEAVAALDSAGFVLGDVAEAADRGRPGRLRHQPGPGGRRDGGRRTRPSRSPSPQGRARSRCPTSWAWTWRRRSRRWPTPASRPRRTRSTTCGRRPTRSWASCRLPASLPTPGLDVGLLVSKGVPTETTVPEVTGLSEAQATAPARPRPGSRPCPPRRTATPSPRASSSGQDPAAGEVVAPLSEVLIEVSLGKGDADRSPCPTSSG